MIFDMYLQGEMGASKIANELTRLGRKNASGLVKWSPCVITRIVNNPTYMGYQAYGKSYSNNYYITSQQHSRDNTGEFPHKQNQPFSIVAIVYIIQIHTR